LICEKSPSIESRDGLNNKYKHCPTRETCSWLGSGHKKILKSLLVLFIIEYGKNRKKTDVNNYTCPASKTTGQGGRMSGIFMP